MMRGKTFLERLQDGFIVGDGDHSYRFQQLVPTILSRGSGLINLMHPELMPRVHSELAEVGTEVISTNTFAAPS